MTVLFLSLPVHLQHVFSHWKRLSQGAMTQRGKLEAASQHYTRQIAKKCLLSWKQYRDHCLRVMVSTNKILICTTDSLLIREKLHYKKDLETI